MDQYEFIRVANRNYGKGIRQIARETGHSRKTIRKALAGMSPKYRLRKKRKRPVMDAVAEIVERILIDDQKCPKKQRHTGQRLYERLVDEHGFKGSVSSVRRFVRLKKQELGVGVAESMVPLCPEVPGEAEVDWGEAVVHIAGREQKVKVFCMRPRKSGKPFVRAYPNESQEMLFDAHRHAFAYFGGVFPVLVYDNMKTVVQKMLKGKDRIEQKQFQLFRAHYTFTARFCNPRRGNEKGGVEGLVKQARRSLMVPIPKVGNLKELNTLLLEGCERLSEKVLGGRQTRQPIHDLFEEEKDYLIRLPKTPFEVRKVLKGKVSKYQTVQVEGVTYSVPSQYVGYRVEVSVEPERVVLSCMGSVMARHSRCFERGSAVLDPLHYLEVLERKPGAFERAKPLKAWREAWPTSHEYLLDTLRNRDGEAMGTKVFLQVLMLYRRYARKDVETAITRGVAQGLYEPAGIEDLLTSDHPEPCPSLPASKLPERCKAEEAVKPNLDQYDRLVVA